jgi:stearoyl-CoA desaturase (delta-9 desaturase)
MTEYPAAQFPVVIDEATASEVKTERQFSWKNIPFLLMHLACFTVVLVGASWSAVALCLVLYFVRMFGLTAGYHRYFSHRSYKTSRAFQFLLAALACAATQKGPLWWAAHHRRHHRFSDQEGDVHSPVRSGFWWSHVGWILSTKYEETDFDGIKDFARYPELRWLNRWHLIPAIALAVSCYLIGGWQYLVWGYVISTVMLYHGTFVINSLAHVWGNRRYETTDDSRNNFWLAIITGGEGWHNNHHHYMASVRQGFFWWEIDTSYYLLRLLSWFGIVWDLRLPPEHLLKGNRKQNQTT